MICPKCEHNRKRMELWREECYRVSGSPLPKEWVDMPDDEIDALHSFWSEKDGNIHIEDVVDFVKDITSRLKELNT